MGVNFLLKLKGYVGGYNFDSEYVDYKLAQAKDTEVHVLIDSLGGDVGTALSIASAFRNHGKVTVHFTGLNASAATIASMGAKKIIIDKNGMYLVHKVSSVVMLWRSMNADQLRDKIEELKKTASNLEKIDLNIAEMYSDRCKKKKEDLLALMEVGGWLTAQEALDWGFVDEIEAVEGQKPVKLSASMVADMNAAGIPVPDMARDSMFSRLVDELRAIFRPDRKEEPTQKNMKFDELYPNLTAGMSADEMAAVGTLDAALLKKMEANATPKPAVPQGNTGPSPEDGEKPADTTTQVVDARESGISDDYISALNRAQELYNILK